MFVFEILPMLAWGSKRNTKTHNLLFCTVEIAQNKKVSVPECLHIFSNFMSYPNNFHMKRSILGPSNSYFLWPIRLRIQLFPLYFKRIRMHWRKLDFQSLEKRRRELARALDDNERLIEVAVTRGRADKELKLEADIDKLARVSEEHSRSRINSDNMWNIFWISSYKSFAHKSSFHIPLQRLESMQDELSEMHRRREAHLEPLKCDE